MFRSFVRSFGHSFSFSFSGCEGGVLSGNNVLVWGCFHSFQRGSVAVILFWKKVFGLNTLKVCMYCGYDYTERLRGGVGWLWIEDAYDSKADKSRIDK